VWNVFHSGGLRAAANPSRLALYAVTGIFEWLLLAFVAWGSSGWMVLGPRWQSARQVRRDIGVAALLWIVSAIVLYALGWVLRATELGSNVQFMLTRGRTPSAGCWWESSDKPVGPTDRLAPSANFRALS
jgi:hypothetical protein